MHQGEGEVFVEEVAEELAHADVRPASVDQQKTLEITELSKRVIAGHHRLHPLLTANAHANVCSCKGSWDRMLAKQFNRYMQTPELGLNRGCHGTKIISLFFKAISISQQKLIRN